VNSQQRRITRRKKEAAMAKFCGMVLRRPLYPFQRDMLRLLTARKVMWRIR
jgi:hypothetical protein